MKLNIQNLLSDSKTLVLADQVVFSGGSFVLTLLLARLLGPANFGIYSSIVLFIYLMISLVNALVIQPLQVNWAGIENQSSYQHFTFWLQSGLMLLLFPLVFIIQYTNFQYFKIFQPILYASGSLIAGFLMHDYFRKLFLAQANPRHAFIVDVITTGIQISALAVFTFYSEPDFNTILTILALSYLPACIVSLFFLKIRFKKGDDWQDFAKIHKSQSSWLVMSALTQWWSGNLFVLASGTFLGVAALGAFRLVQSLFGLLNLFLQSLENYALPRTSVLLRDSGAEARLYLQNISKKSLIFFGIILSILFLGANQIILLAGGVAYADYGYVVRGMTILYFIIVMGYPVRIAIRVLLLNSNFFTGYLLSLIFSLTSFHYLLQVWGLPGAIAGLVFSQIISLAYWQYILVKNNFSIWK